MSSPGPDEPVLEVLPDGVADRLDAPTRAVLADPGWKRLHPVTPVLRAWKVVAAVLAVVVGQNVDDLLRLELPGWVLTLAVLGGVLALALVGAGFSALSWRRTRYRIDNEGGVGAVHVERGILWRQQRRAQLDRLQAVDVVRPLLGRLFGLAELQLEVAGGSGSKVSLAYLKEEEAQRVRNALLAAAAGLVVAEGEEAPEAPQREVVEVPATRLITSTLKSGLTIGMVLVLVGIAVGCWFARSLTPLFGSAAVVLGLVSAVWQRFSTGFNFTVADSPDGLRLTHGLLEQRSQTVPPGRVQALRITQPLLWRRSGWWRVEVNVAGYSSESGSGSERSTTLLPVGTVEELGLVLGIVLPDLATEDRSALDVVRAGLTGPAPTAASRPSRGRRAGWTGSAGAAAATSSPTTRSCPAAAGSCAVWTSSRTRARRASGSSRARGSAGSDWRACACTPRRARSAPASTTSPPTSPRASCASRPSAPAPPAPAPAPSGG